MLENKKGNKVKTKHEQSTNKSALIGTLADGSEFSPVFNQSKF